MSKAEDLAEKLYPKKEHVAYGPFPCEEPNMIDDNKPYRIGFVEAYKQAEKDNELTWEDIPEIFRISEELKTSWWFRDNEQTKLIGTQTFWEEVLKRFKDFKERKKNGE